MPLTAEEARVLGALMEKQVTTPEYYPLTLNALVSACNQTSNRSPVVRYDEPTVQAALDRLRHEEGLVRIVHSTSNRAPKWRQVMDEKVALVPEELAVLCVLLLRGPQTLGEVKGRTERMYAFESLEEVEAALDRLARRDPPLATRLERQPGQKEARYAHLLSGEPDLAAAEAERSPTSSLADRVASLEAEVAELRALVEELVIQD